MENLDKTITEPIKSCPITNPIMSCPGPISSCPGPIKSWDDIDLKPALLRGIYAYGFENPSEIQKRAICPMITCSDIIAQAQSGSGKTGAFMISALQMVDLDQPTIQTIILAPTHELVKQIAQVGTHLGNMMTGLRLKTLIGGVSVHDDAREMRENTPHIVVGTVGRVHDMIRRRFLPLESVRLIIMDEADEMLSQGFQEQIYQIFQYLRSDIQVALFSATLPEPMMDLTSRFMRDPIKVTMPVEKLNLECIEQLYVAVSDDLAKYDMIKQLFASISVSQCIIYCNSVKRVADLYCAMMKDGYSVCAVHSSMDKVDRDTSFHQFRNGGVRVLISSNVTARGIDIQQVSTVINFDIPRCEHTYLHRIGRSGRWGRKGMAINFITRHDVQMMKFLENYYKIEIKELRL